MFSSNFESFRNILYKNDEHCLIIIDVLILNIFVNINLVILILYLINSSLYFSLRIFLLKFY